LIAGFLFLPEMFVLLQGVFLHASAFVMRLGL